MPDRPLTYDEIKHKRDRKTRRLELKWKERKTLWGPMEKTPVQVTLDKGEEREENRK